MEYIIFINGQALKRPNESEEIMNMFVIFKDLPTIDIIWDRGSVPNFNFIFSIGVHGNLEQNKKSGQRIIYTIV